MQPEYRIVRNIKKLIRSRGGWCVKIHGSPYQDSGTPDLLACYKGRFIAIELKTSRGVSSPEQREAKRAITECGGYALITHLIGDVADVLDAIDKL
jgi:Holliday junction resolvase